VNVLFFPYWPANPYQPNLAKVLGKRGAEVKCVEDSSFLTFISSSKE
jgi:hypothetical protein